jgi:hypothetical protein
MRAEAPIGALWWDKKTLSPNEKRDVPYHISNYEKGKPCRAYHMLKLVA